VKIDKYPPQEWKEATPYTEGVKQATPHTGNVEIVRLLPLLWCGREVLDKFIECHINALSMNGG